MRHKERPHNSGPLPNGDTIRCQAENAKLKLRISTLEAQLKLYREAVAGLVRTNDYLGEDRQKRIDQAFDNARKALKSSPGGIV